MDKNLFAEGFLLAVGDRRVSRSALTPFCTLGQTDAPSVVSTYYNGARHWYNGA